MTYSRIVYVDAAELQNVSDSTGVPIDTTNFYPELEFDGVRWVDNSAVPLPLVTPAPRPDLADMAAVGPVLYAGQVMA